MFVIEPVFDDCVPALFENPISKVEHRQITMFETLKLFDPGLRPASY